tara:strand:+ start:524 stop:760 length:237 start_codon:yes stop_codon:yes gene_type:complete
MLVHNVQGWTFLNDGKVGIDKMEQSQLEIEEYLAELREEEYFAELREIAKAISDAHQPITKIDHSQYWCIAGSEMEWK